MAKSSHYPKWKKTPALLSRICERIAKGEAAYKISLDEDMPSWPIICKWDREDKQFGFMVMRAREAAADFMDAKISKIADSATKENWQVDRLQIETLKWQAAHSRPNRYSDRVEHTGADGRDLVPSAMKITIVGRKNAAE